MPRHFTAEHDQEIADLYLAGRPTPEIARQFGVSITPILRALGRSGIPIRRGGRVSSIDDSPEGRARIVTAYQNGESIRGLAKRLKVGEKQIHRVLDLEEIPKRPSGSARMFSDQETNMIVAAYQAGATTTQLAEQYGTNHITIRNYLVREGVTLRPGGPERFWTDERKAEAVERYTAGESQQQIADAFGVDQTGVSSMLRELGVQMRGNPRVREKNHAWKGGRIVDGYGYTRIQPEPADMHLTGPLYKGGYVMEHRIVMAKKLGRPLRRSETVHHINGDKQDNRPENLQLRQGNHGNGVRIGCLDCGSSNVGHLPLS